LLDNAMNARYSGLVLVNNFGENIALPQKRAATHPMPWD
jgi:hypothetical protein